MPRRVRVTVDTGAEELRELFADLGALELIREGNQVTGGFEDAKPEGLEDRVEQFLHLIDREGTARLETARDGGPWALGWRAIFQGLDVGRFRIRPPWMPLPADGVPVIVDPRGAFGSGLHPSTRLALELLGESALRGGQMLDVGAGSGILAVAAARLGFAVCALELEASARAACARTAAANGVVLEVLDATPAKLGRKFELVVANMPGATLLELAAELHAAVKPDGTLIVSGTRSEALPEMTRLLGAAARELRSADGEWAAASWSGREA
jgi:ribosomal protein L11 methyltransferase